MKVFGDNSTSYSAPDEEGQRYSASFEFYPFYEGLNFSVYKGMLNGRGRRRAHFCAVKTLADRPGVCQDWSCYLSASSTARRLAAHFHAHCCSHRPVLLFSQPRLAALVEVSQLNKLFRFFLRYKKRLRREEVVCVEELVEGAWLDFDSAPPSDQSEPLAALAQPNMAQAFSHFTWWFSRDLVVCGLKGVRVGKTYELVTPVIHSRGHAFGDSDRGWAGIQEFFSGHRCNAVCRNWPGPELPLPALPLPSFPPPLPPRHHHHHPRSHPGSSYSREGAENYSSGVSHAQSRTSSASKSGGATPPPSPAVLKSSVDSGFASIHEVYGNYSLSEAASRL